MNWLALAFALELGVLPNNDWIMYDPPALVLESPELYQQFEARAILWGSPVCRRLGTHLRLDRGGPRRLLAFARRVFFRSRTDLRRPGVGLPALLHASGHALHGIFARLCQLGGGLRGALYPPRGPVRGSKAQKGVGEMEELIVVEFVHDGTAKPLLLGEKYSYFQDPKTGKYYRPAAGFTVKGTDLSDRFVEISIE